MTASMRKGRALLAVWFAHMSAYRAEIIIWMLTGSLPLIMLAVWIGKARVNGGSVNGYTPSGFAAYFLAAWVTQQFMVAWVSWELDRQIRLGELSPKLLRPIDVFWEHLAAHVTERMVRLPFMVVIVTLGALLVPGTRVAPSVAHIAVYLVCVSMAFLVRFLIAYCIGLLTFWFDQATALDEFYYIVAAFLTGSFAPLDLYPPAVRAAIEWTPFPYLIYYPVQVLNGTLGGAAIARVLLVLAGWVIIFAMLKQVLWRFGLRRYGAVGA